MTLRTRQATHPPISGGSDSDSDFDTATVDSSTGTAAITTNSGAANFGTAASDDTNKTSSNTFVDAGVDSSLPNASMVDNSYVGAGKESSSSMVELLNYNRRRFLS